MSEITIRGRIATTSLRRGETATVERTDAVDRLIAGGFVEVMDRPAAPTPEPEQAAEDQPDTDSEPEAEAPRRTRKKTSS